MLTELRVIDLVNKFKSVFPECYAKILNTIHISGHPNYSDEELCKIESRIRLQTGENIRLQKIQATSNNFDYKIAIE